ASARTNLFDPPCGASVGKSVGPEAISRGTGAGAITEASGAVDPTSGGPYGVALIPLVNVSGDGSESLRTLIGAGLLPFGPDPASAAPIELMRSGSLGVGAFDEGFIFLAATMPAYGLRR